MAKTDSALLAAWWRAPTDDDLLRVIADHWAEHGDPRGEFVQLSLLEARTQEQDRKLATLKKLGGKLVGPARPFLREWDFGSNGVVERARCEADKLAEGIDEIDRLNPLLSLCLTSLKKRTTMAALARVSLAPIHYVATTMNIIGSLGGSNVSDKALVAVAPAFRGVRNLAFQVRGFADDCFSPASLRTFADHLEGLEFFGLDYYAATQAGKTPLAPVDAYAEVVATHPAFATLKAVFINGANPTRLEQLPAMVRVVTNSVLDGLPSNARELAAIKT